MSGNDINIGKVEGNIVEITNKSTSCIVGPLFGVFALGMFTRRANQLGAIVGSVLGFVVAMIVNFIVSSAFPSRPAGAAVTEQANTAS